MTEVRAKRRVALAAGGLALATAAIASPPVNFTGALLVAATLTETVRVNSGAVKLQTKGPVDTSVRRLEWGPGGSSGWHHHPGMVLVEVASGSIDVTRVEHGRCETQTYSAGQAFIEGDSVHYGYSAGGAVAYATTIVEAGEPARLEDDPPACASRPAVRTPG